MSKIVRCDICGRTSTEVPNITQFKMKRKWHDWYESGWERIDICSDCEREIRLKVRKDSEEE